MKRIKIFASIAIAAAALTMTSCKDWLQLGPEDYYGSENYWTKGESAATGYIHGLHKNLRDHYNLHVDHFGDLRGGLWKTGVSIDGTALSYGDIINCNFDDEHTMTTNFGNIYGRIFNCNILIKNLNDENFDCAADKKAYYLGIAHGLRAFYFFDLYRNYGGAPLRTGTEVADGILDPTLLYMARATPAEVAKQIEEDIEASLSYFGNTTQFNPFNMDATNRKHYWSKAASEALAADFYLWQAKVSTGNYSATGANGADLAKAEQHLKSLEANYGLSMQNNFKDVFSTSNKGNSEVIFAIYFDETEATNNRNIWTMQTNAEVVGAGYTNEGKKITADMLVSEFNSFTRLDLEYKVEFLRQFDAADTRYLATFYPVYRETEVYTPDMVVDGKNLKLRGSLVRKNIGHISSSSGTRTFDGDIILYRLPWVYLSLAEVANMKGDAATVKKYVDLVRQRAYGADWDAGKYGFTAGDFKTNELGILMEKTKEFVQEGQRWYDLRRMKTAANGGPETALVFSIEAAIENGVDRDIPEPTDAVPNPVVDPIAAQLDYNTEAHKVLLPLDKTLLGNDAALEQTPGY